MFSFTYNKVAMKKITTLSSLAKVCGCSPATVSYVLNGRNDQRISEETKQKVLQMANLYQYRINPYAKALATGELHNIMFFYDFPTFSLMKSETLNFINELAEFLKKNRYNLVIAPVDKTQEFKFVDAVVTYNISKETFMELANKNFVPVIAIDTIVSDNLFFEVVNDFSFLKKDDNILYLSFPFKDTKINDEIMQNANVCFINSYNELQEVIKQNKQFISLSAEIHDYLKALNISVELYEINTKNKYEAILQSINDSIARSENKTHHFRI